MSSDLPRQQIAIQLCQQAFKLLNQNQVNQAIIVSQNVLKIQPQFAKAYQLLGIAFQINGEDEIAQSQYIKALEIQPSFPEVYANLGSLYAQQKQWQDAVKMYRIAIHLKPSIADFYCNLAQILTQVHQHQKETNCWHQDNIELELASAEEYFTLGNHLVKQQQLEWAKLCYQKAIKLRSDYGEAYYYLGEIWTQEQNFQQAAICYQQALKFKPQSVMTYQRLGETWEQLQLWDRVIALCKKAIDGNIGCVWAYHHLGKALVQQKHWEAAIAVYQKLLAIAPNSVWAYHHLADIFKQQQRYQAAIEAYRKELYLNPESYWSYIHLGELLIKTHQSQEAITVYQQVIEKQPDFLAAYYNWGKISLQQKKWQDAVTAYHKATELDPDSFWAYQCLARALYRQGKALMQQPQNDALLLQENSWKQSIDAYLKAIKLKPDLSSWYYEQEFWNLAQHHNQLDYVIEIYRQLIQHNPDLVNCHVNLGKALSLQGKKAEAMTCYRAAGRQITFAKYTRLQNQSNLKLIPAQSPDFIIIGAQKCGTTSLYHYLAQHPNIICSIIKETDFWLNDFHQGLEWYLAQFPPRLQGEKILIGEASPNYLNERDVPERLFQVFPNVKLIVLLRNPVNRAISHYYHSLRGGWTSCPLPEAIETEIQKLQNQEQDYWNQPNGYVARGVYIEFLKKWMTIFPKEQFLILRSEDFYTQPESTLMQVFDFLNLPPASEMNLKPYNQGFYQPIPIKLRQKLHTFFQPYNQQLEAFLEMNFHWNLD